MKHNYFVSVFVGGKNVNSYYSENLDDLVTIKALYKDCEICIFDMNTCESFSKEHVNAEINASGLRWKKSQERTDREDVATIRQKAKKGKRNKPKKYWERPVLCVETGQVFCSIRECCERLGLSHKSLWNAINSGNSRNGLHFVNAPKLKRDSDESDK